MVCHKVIEGEGAKRAALLESGTSGWHGETKFISKHSNLKQVKFHIISIVIGIFLLFFYQFAYFAGFTSY